jgi:hypothetical protein
MTPFEDLAQIGGKAIGIARRGDRRVQRRRSTPFQHLENCEEMTHGGDARPGGTDVGSNKAAPAVKAAPIPEQKT